MQRRRHDHAGTTLKPFNGCNDSAGYSFHTGGMQAAFADGSVHFLSENVDAKTWAALVTRSGGGSMVATDGRVAWSRKSASSSVEPDDDALAKMVQPSYLVHVIRIQN